MPFQCFQPDRYLSLLVAKQLRNSALECIPHCASECQDFLRLIAPVFCTTPFIRNRHRISLLVGPMMKMKARRWMEHREKRKSLQGLLRCATTPSMALKKSCELVFYSIQIYLSVIELLRSLSSTFVRLSYRTDSELGWFRFIDFCLHLFPKISLESNILYLC